MASAEAPAIVVVTHFASPYQVELFDEVEKARPGALAIYYIRRSSPTRSWSPVALHHRAFFLEDGDEVMERARRHVTNAQFVVFNYYQDRRAAELIGLRASIGRHWCFWGERPGYRYPRLGRLLRLWMLRALHVAPQPIWGIGGWAVDAYKQEFGQDRTYVNLPYFSELTRFQSNAGLPFGRNLVFLYSGSLSPRKGVDLLARAFCRIAQEEPGARLKIMGQGPIEDRMRAELAPCISKVEWIGFKNWGELPDVYASAHILCVPSRHDGWGLVVPEGLAAGLPVIATDRTGAALDLIEPGFNGWLVPAENEDALYKSMREAVKLSHEQWHTMSRNARHSVAEHTLAAGAGRFLAAVDLALSDSTVR